MVVLEILNKLSELDGEEMSKQFVVLLEAFGEQMPRYLNAMEVAGLIVVNGRYELTEIGKEIVGVYRRVLNGKKEKGRKEKEKKR